MISSLTTPRRLSWRSPGVVLLLSAASFLLLIPGLLRLRIDATLDAIFPRHDPAAAALMDVMSHFGAADDLLVLVKSPDVDPDRLLAYADRFTAAVRESPQARALCDGVQYRADPDIERFIKQELAPAGLFYLSDSELAAARQRLTPHGMRQQLSKDRSMLAMPGPAAGALARQMMRDPLSLRDFLLPRLDAARPMQTYQNSDAMIDPTGHALLIRVLGNRPPTDVDYASRLTRLMAQIAQRAQPNGLTVQLSGAYAIAAQSAAAIRRDAIESVCGSILLLIALFVAAYRKPARLFLLAFFPIALGTLAGFGAYGWLPRTLSPIAAVIGGVLAGMGIDYTVLFMTRYESLRASGNMPPLAARQAKRDIGPAVLAAWATSIAGFLAIGCSSIQMLRDFALLGTLGLTGCFLATMLVLPATLALFDSLPVRLNQPTVRFSVAPMLEAIARRRRLLLAFSLLTMLAAAIIIAWPGGKLLRGERDLSVMHPHPNPALDAEAEINRLFGIAPGTLLIHLKASSPTELIALDHQVQQRLSTPSAKAAGIGGIYGIATWLPDPPRTAKLLAAGGIGDADAIVRDFHLAAADNGFRAGAFTSYEATLRQLLDPKSTPDVATLRKYPGLARTLLPNDARHSTESVTIVFLSHPTEDLTALDATVDFARSALAELPDATLTGLPVVGHDAETAVRRELPRLLAAAAILVAAYLALHFRRLSASLLALLPAVFGALILAAVVRLVGARLNMINLVALPLLVGIDVDYGIYLVSLGRRQVKPGAIAAGAHAVIVCSASIVLGYVSLETASVPAIQSLGWIVAVGVVGCVIGAFTLLCPLLPGLSAHRAVQGAS